YYPASGSGSNNYLSYIISPGQGFLVKLKAGAANSVVFKNIMRRAATPTATATTGQPFFRTLNVAAPSRYWLNLSNASGSYGQALVAYSQEGTTGIDYGFDGVEMADGPIRLFSRAENTNLSIQARPEFVVTDEVPMGFNVTAPGQYTVSIHDKDGVFADGQNIYLKDNLQGVTHNLSDSAYSFITEADNFNGRFEVVYMTSTLGTANPELALNNVMVYKNDNAININTGVLEMTGVAIYDIRGRKLYADNNLSGTQTAITGLNIAQQVIIVEVTTVAGKVSKKIIF
ncbi:MAG: T9SS sorting signal type C domain-containing protein, partial [Sphingobacteriales bacterium]